MKMTFEEGLKIYQNAPKDSLLGKHREEFYKDVKKAMTKQEVGIVKAIGYTNTIIMDGGIYWRIVDKETGEILNEILKACVWKDEKWELI